MCRSIHRHNNLIPFSKKHLIYIKLKVLYRTLQTKYASSISSGFSAVSTSAMGDLADWLFFSKQGDVGKVGRVTIKGEADFKKGDSFQKDDPVIVYYHSYPDSNDN